MCKIFLSWLFVLCALARPACAVIGASDNRENVDWADYPEIVLFDAVDGMAECYGQYIAPNIVLSTRSCVGGTIGETSIVRRGGKANYCVFVSEANGDDWALLRVRDEKCHSKEFLQPSPTRVSGKISVEYVGDGWMRVWDKGEGPKIKKVFEECAKENGYTQMGNPYYLRVTEKVNSHVWGLNEAEEQTYDKPIDDALQDLNDCLVKKGIKNLNDKSGQLKADKNCYVWPNGEDLASDCDVDSGKTGTFARNSNGQLVGILSTANPSFDDTLYKSFFVPSVVFYDAYKNLVQKYPVDGFSLDDGAYSANLAESKPQKTAPDTYTLDERKYVEWAQYPQIVALISDETNTFCTGQYIAKNLILTARHCVTPNSLFDNNAQLGKKYEITRFDGQTTQATLVKYGEDTVSCVTGVCKDWAWLMIEDENFYSNDYFKISKTDVGRNTDVSRAGFGWLRILSDAELEQIKQIVQNYVKENGLRYQDENNMANDGFFVDENQAMVTLSSVLSSLNEKISAAGIKPLRDGDLVLKAHEGCKLSKQENRLVSSCASWGGDSGSGVWNAENPSLLYGSLQGGWSSLDAEYNEKIYAGTAQYYDAYQDLVKNGKAMLTESVGATNEEVKDTQEPKADTVSVAMPVTQAETDASDANVADTVVNEQEQRRVQEDLQRKQEEIEEKEKSVAKDIAKGDALTVVDVLKLTGDMVSIEVLKEQYEAAKAKYEAAKAREQSLANRILGAAAIGAAGVGGMQLASAMAERAADDAAELDMTAYLATFACDYGAGRNIAGGEADVELPVADLFGLRQDYINLANSLKNMKNALGVPAGIEVAEIADSATSGLYDNVGAAPRDGVYTSLSRALMDENSADAAEWAAQRADTDSKLKTGATLGGTGIVGGAVGDMIINRDAK